MENLSPWHKNRKVLFYGGGGAALVLLLYLLLISAPGNFPNGAIVNISEGSGLRSVSLKLKEANIIRSRTAFEAFVIFFGGERRLIPADYLFEKGEPAWSVARRISTGDRHLAPVKVTIPEGFTVAEMADLFASRLPAFDKTAFLAEASDEEGQLFPDTYFFFTTDTEVEALRALRTNFEKKFDPLREEITKSGKTEAQILSMASIIEHEAEGDADRALISGILWRRISIGMALQADAAPITYKERGLPKSPICNPGLESIRAAIHPEKSDYLYYLHDKEGNIHYAKNFTEHRANIETYLKN